MRPAFRGCLVRASVRIARGWLRGARRRAPADADSASRGAAPDRATVLGELLPALRAACRRAGALTTDELREFAERDWALGRRVREPRAGVVAGISPAGELVIDTATGQVHCATGSLVLDGETS